MIHSHLWMNGPVKMSLTRLRVAIGQSINDFYANVAPQKTGRPRLCDRTMIEGIVYILRTGIPWRDLPRIFGKWQSVYTRFRRWKLLGLIDFIFNQAIDEDSLACRFIDSTSCKVHKHSNGRSDELQPSIGASKGGRNTKIHAYVDGTSRLCRFILSPGNDSDIKHAEALVQDVSEKKIVGDKGYTSFAFRRKLEEMGNTHCIAQRSNESLRESFHRGYYRKRHKVENIFQRLKEYRRIATRYDTTDTSFIAFIHIAATIDWLKRTL